MSNRHYNIGSKRHPAVRVRDTHGFEPDWLMPEVRGTSFAEARDGEQSQTGDIAPDAVDGRVHVMDGSLGPELFASTIRPPIVVSALPALPDAAWPQGSLVFLTTDQKLYRNTTGSVWSRAVDGADLIADSVVAGAIAAGAVGADEIAANAIVTSKFHVDARAPGVNNNPGSPGSGEVLIDPSGITIKNGKIVLQDPTGRSVLNAAGFAGSWIGFLESSVYNSQFQYGPVQVSQTTETTSLSTDAATDTEYLNALAGTFGVSFPLWIIRTLEPGNGLIGSRRIDTGINEDATPERAMWASSDVVSTIPQYMGVFQDAPVVPNVDYALEIDWRTLLVGTPTGAACGIVVKRHWRTSTHAAIESSSTVLDDRQGGTITRHRALADLGTAPANAAYCRVELELHVTADATSQRQVWVYGVALQDASRLRSIKLGYLDTWTFVGAKTTAQHTIEVDAAGVLKIAGGKIAYDIQNDTVELPGGKLAIGTTATPANAIGVLLGADVELYRAAADRLALAAGDTLEVNGGKLVLGTTASPANAIAALFGADVELFRGAADRLDLATGDSLRLVGGELQLGADVAVRRGGTDLLLTDDILHLTATNGIIQFEERASDAAAPVADRARLYVRDNGAGKTQLVVRFNTGAVQVLATQP